tara:strand:- start:97 stop:525 length:429 start_codon:yes stop_codon:yes gene_type:complete
MDKVAQRYVDFRNSLLGKATYLTRDVLILSAISPVCAGVYIGGLLGAGFREYNVELNGDERAPNLSVNDQNQWESHPKKSIIKSWRNPQRMDGFLIGGGSMIGLGIGAFLNTKLYEFIEKPQNSGIDYFFSPIASSLVDLVF